MRLAEHPTVPVTGRLLSHFLTALLTLATVSPAAAQAETRGKPPSTGSTIPKMKVPQSGAGSKGARSNPPVDKTEITGVEPKGTRSIKTPAAPNTAVASEDIVEFHAQPAGVRALIEFSLKLARQNLTYTYGSADPANGGFDCSGFIHYVLRQHGLTQVPRDSSGLYAWVRKAKSFRAVISRKPDSFEMDELLPGDLLFWIGTYVTDHDPPVTHTMLYLGTERSTGAKIMIGSSDGRTYRGETRNGVSVFDFQMPRKPAAGEQSATFIGYARIPGLRD